MIRKADKRIKETGIRNYEVEENGSG